VTPRSNDARVVRIVDFFERLSPQALERLADHYASDARFKDPFKDVQGLSEIQAVYRHMFAALDEPRFVVHDVLVQDNQCFLTWDFLFRFKRYSHELQTVRGSSHLHLTSQGLIQIHRDYWDAAEEFYEKLPVIGALMRWLKKRANS
jgi:ketosteroid isomerase-like protein